VTYLASAAVEAQRGSARRGELYDAFVDLDLAIRPFPAGRALWCVKLHIDREILLLFLLK
jgi:hypothetical protein